MADRTLTINHADGGSETYTINRDKFAGVRDMVIDGANVSVDHTAAPKEQSKETTFGGSQSITVNRDIEPLLSKVVGGAAAAYSLRDLNDVLGNSNKVVRVRRSSDNAEKDFTASEMGAALEAWVNADVTIYQSNFSSSTDGWSGSTASPVGNQDGVSDGTTSKDNVLKLTKTQDSQAYIQGDQGVIAGLTYTVSGSFYAPSSNTGVDGILIKDGLAGSSLSSYPSGYLTASGVWTDFSFSYTATRSGNQRINMGISSLGSNPNGSSAGSAGDVVYISDLQFVETTSNGYVQTWYDQSGNGNDAEQTTATKQPKIVGEVTPGQPHAFLGALVFDHTNATELRVTGNPVITADYTGTYSTFSIQTVSNSEFGYLYGNASSTAGSSLYNNGNLYQATNKNTASGFDKIGKTSSKDLLSAVYNNGDAGLLVNGGGTMVDQGIYDFASGSADFKIGNRGGGISSGTYLTGSIEEIIIYNSDQSSNRPAIEANIANQYGITLS